MRHLSILLASTAVISCSYGLTDKTFWPARSPRGIETRVTTTSNQLRGELIELQSSGMVILSSSVTFSLQGRPFEEPESVLRLVPYGSIHHAEFSQLKRPYEVRGGRAPTGDVRERLRLVSRFPYGMSAEVLDRLLRAHGQTALAGFER